MKTIKKRSVIPVYGVAVTWLVLTVALGMHTLGNIAVAVVVSAVVFLILRAVFPTKTEQVKVEEPPKPKDPVQEALEQERARAISELRRLNDNIKDPVISSRIDHLENTTDKILHAVMENPEKQTQIRRFLNYFLPTTIKLLNAYDRADATGISGENIDGTKERVQAMLEELEKAFDKQLDALFADEELDIATDIKVLEAMLAQEGLSEDETYTMPGT